MTNPFNRGMAKATNLTREGKLGEATALIQSLLGRVSKGRADVRIEDGTVIEGDYSRLDPAPRSAPDPVPEPVHSKPRVRRSRTPLSETLRSIASGGMAAHGPTSGTPDPVPLGAQFLALTHASPQGSRRYRLYIPANRTGVRLPLIVMLHGCTQTPEDFAAGTGMNVAAEESGCMIAYPAQPSGANMQKCWNWYRPEDQGRGKGEPALIAGLARDILRDYHGDPARTYVAGLSAGGAAAVVVAAAYPDVFGAVGVHSGLPAGGAHDIPSAFAAMRNGTKSKPHQTVVPTIVFHGLADSTVHSGNGAAVLSQAVQAMPGLQVAVRKDVSQGGRPFRTTTHQDASGRTFAEHWEIEGAGHAWAGGNPAGSYTDAAGPDASREIVRFLLQHMTQ